MEEDQNQKENECRMFFVKSVMSEMKMAQVHELIGEIISQQFDALSDAEKKAVEETFRAHLKSKNKIIQLPK